MTVPTNQRWTMSIPDTPLLPAILRFIERSTLGACASFGYEKDAGMCLKTDRAFDLLSDGEKETWALLDLLVSGTLLTRVEVTAPLGDLAARATLAAHGMGAA